MIRLIGLAISVGLADSLNPTTIAPALYLATGPAPAARAKVVEFTAAVFIVYLLGGIVIALGPGQLLISAIPHPGRHLRWIIEMVVGGTLIVAAVYLWRRRKKLAERPLPTVDAEGKSSALLGATITAIELPTAFPYFAVIAAIVAADLDFPRSVLCLLVFNLCFIAPLVGIWAVLRFAPDRSEHLLGRARDSMEQRWPVLLACVLALAGVFAVWLGATGLAGKFVRRHITPHLPRILR
jgi:cytochrome c biogenesis protein CcdA